MASYFSSWIPQSMQKRLLRYVIVNWVPWVDSTALDLDQLEFQIGTQTTLKFNDVRLDCSRLQALLGFPAEISIAAAMVSSLTINIPADLFRSRIEVTIEGVNGKVALPSKQHEPPSGKSQMRGNRRNCENDQVTNSVLISPEEVAVQFIKSQPMKEKRKLERSAITYGTASGFWKDDLESGSGIEAYYDESPEDEEEGKIQHESDGQIAEGSRMRSSSVGSRRVKVESQNQDVKLSDNEESDSELGTGTSLSLPDFLASFLRGIGDKLQVQIKDVKISVDVPKLDLIAQSPSTGYPTGHGSEDEEEFLTLELVMESLDVQGVTSWAPEVGVTVPGVGSGQIKPEKRRILLGRLYACLVGDEPWFDNPKHSRPYDSELHSMKNADSRDVEMMGNAASVNDSIHPEKEIQGSVDTLKGYPSEPSKAFECHEGVSDWVSDDPSYFRADSEVAEEEKLSQSVAYFSGDSSDAAGTHLSESQKFSDYEDEGGELPFSNYYGNNRIDNIQGSKPPKSTKCDQVATEAGSTPFSVKPICHYKSVVSLPTAPREATEDTMSRSSPALLTIPNSSAKYENASDGPACCKLNDGYCSDTSSTTSGDEAARKELSESMVFSREQAESLYYSVASRVQGTANENAFKRSVIHESKLDDTSVKMGDEISAEEIEERIGRLVGAGGFRNEHELNNMSEAESPVSSLHVPASVTRRMRKMIAQLDYIEIWVPALNKSEAPDKPTAAAGAYSATIGHDNPQRGSNIEATHPYLPGSFSMYAASRFGVMDFPSGQPSKTHRNSYIESNPGRERPVTPQDHDVRFADEVRSPISRLDDSAKQQPLLKQPEAEVFIGSIQAKLDMTASTIIMNLLKLFKSVAVNSAQSPVQDPETQGAVGGGENQPRETDEVHNMFEISIGEVTCKLVEALEGRLAERGDHMAKAEEDEQTFRNCEDETVLGLLVQGTKISLTRTIPATSSSMARDIIVNTRADITKFSIQDCHGPFIYFIPELPPSLNLTKKSHLRFRKKRTSTDKFLPVQHEISINMTVAGNKKKVVIDALPLRVNCELQRLEDLFGWFGGFGSVLGLGSAHLSSGMSSPMAQKQGKNVMWKDDRGSKDNQHQVNASDALTPQAGEMRVDVKLGGLMIDVVGKDGAVALRTSIIRLKKTDSTPLVIGIDKIIILGPQLVDQLDTADARISIDTTRIEFGTSPNDDDLARLLRLLTPSSDRFTQEDDIMIPLLLDQRRQGSVLRISVDKVTSGLDDIKECERFLSLSEEIGKVLTVTDYISQDERPGIMTLLYVGSLETSVELGMLAGHIGLTLSNVELLHVSAPTLFALAITSISAKRNGSEELIGEGLPRDILSPTKGEGHIEDRPMIMVRMVGDEPEPVVKIKLWNLKLEYRLETLMAFTGRETGESIAKEVMDSIVSVATVVPKTRIDVKGKRKESLQPKITTSEKKSLAIDVAIRDSVLGLNPLGLPSRGLIVFTDSNVVVDLPSPSTYLRTTVDLNKSSIFIIDDTSHVLSPHEGKSHHGRRKSLLSDNLIGFAAAGYVPVATISSAKAVAEVVGTGISGEKCLEAEVRDVFFLMETCADSTQTLLGIVNGLKPPTPEEEQVKYRTEIMPVEMFQSICEDAFVHPWTRKRAADGELTSSLLAVEEAQPEPNMDTITDDGPMSLSFEESYYGHREVKHTEENLAQSILESDPAHTIGPGSLEVGERVVLTSLIEPTQLLDDVPIEILEDHFPQPSKEDVSLIAIAAKQARGTPLKAKVRDVHFIWNLHDGYDWAQTRDTLTKAVKRMEFRASERYRNRTERRTSFDMEDDDESVIDDFLFNSIYIGIPANKDPRELTRQINNALDADNMSETSYASTGFESRPSSRSRASTDPSKRKLKFNRSRSHKVQFELKGVSIDFVLYAPEAGETQSSVDLRVKDLEIIDNVPTSTWKKFVTYMQDAGKRETGSNMIHIEVLNVKPVPELTATELVIRTTILPLRLHVDQDTLDFMTRFFAFKDNSTNNASPAGEEPFIQRVEVNSIRVKLDYKPKKVDYVGLRSGHTTEFMNFFILEEADMVLRHVILHGISGFERMGQELNDIWMPDVKRTQLPDVLSGLAPVRSLVNIGAGVKNLVAVPIREYKRDGRIVRSLQKGAVKFAKTTASEVVKFGAKLAVGTQGWLEATEELLGGQGSAGRGESGGIVVFHQGSDEEDEEPKVISLYADQPKNVLQGLKGASASLKKNLNTARDAMRSVPEDISQRGSAAGVAQAVARAAPIVVLRPMIGATEAISKTLLGVTNSIDPENQRRVDDKYKKH